MNSLLSVTLLFVTLVSTVVIGKFTDRKILVSKFIGHTKSPKSLTDLHQIRSKIRNETIANLRLLSASAKTDLLHLADTALKGSYPVNTAIGFLEIHRDGVRETYEDVLHAHRLRLSLLAVGQLLEDEQGSKSSHKYLNEIVNGVWMIAEESSWAYPAHIGGQLPPAGSTSLELNGGEVAKTLAWVKLLLGDQFDHISPVINKRIDAELRRRVFQDFLNQNYWWESFGAGHSSMNWNIWINSNILKSALFTLDDFGLFEKVLNRTIYSADYFMDNYDNAGGCDEGPFYWRHGSGRLIEFLESLMQIFGPEAKQYLSTVELIKHMGEYSYKMRIEQNWFVNFADAFPRLTYPPSILAKYGELFNDDTMRNYASYMMQYAGNASLAATSYGRLLAKDDLREMINLDLNEFLNVVNMQSQFAAYKPVAPQLDHVWLSDVQVVTARSHKNATSKLFLGAKAGNNHEDHNHNDVGHFIIYQDGTPVLIDIGVGAYVAKSFSGRRYELFFTRSEYHSCPNINGIQQHDGSTYTSHQTSFQEFPNSEGIHFQSDIAGAYPTTAHVKHWIRSLNFNRTSNSIQLDDQYQLDKYLAPQQLHFIINPHVEIEKTTQGLRFHQTNGKANLLAEFDWSLFEMKIEERSVDGDFRLERFWGKFIKRITLTTLSSKQELQGHYKFRFSPAK